MANRTAMIDVGGGFRAIYGAGVMDRMLEDGMHVDHCYGVSAGSANMVSYISGQHGRNHTFYTQYAFRKEYASFDSYVKNHNYANLDYVYSTLSNHDGENPVDYEAFAANPTEFTVVACNADDGSTKYFDKSDVGHDRIVVILTRPKDTVREQKKDIGPATILKRTHPEAAEKLMNRYQTYNDEVALAKEYEKDGRVLILAPESMYGLNTLSKSFEGLERMYRAGYAAAAAIPAFLES